MLNITGYHHIGLRVADMDQSLKFYTEGLGGKVIDSFVMGNTGRMIYMVELCAGAVVELLPGGNNGEECNARWAHIALSTDDAAAAYEQALQAGATSRTAPNTVTRDKMTRSNAFVFGPEGEIIEFFQVIKQAE